MNPRLIYALMLVTLVGCSVKDGVSMDASPIPSTETPTSQPTAEPSITPSLTSEITETATPESRLPDYYQPIPGDFDETSIEAVSIDGAYAVLSTRRESDLILELLETGTGKRTVIAGDGWNWAASISLDGLYVAFISYSEDLAGGDCSRLDGASSNSEELFCGSLYLYEVATGNLHRYPLGEGLGLATIDETSISSEGRFVAFIHGMGQLELLDTASGNMQPLYDQVMDVEISGDGQIISYVQMIEREGTRYTFDVFRLDRSTGEVTRITQSQGREYAASGAGWFQSENVFRQLQMSPDGRFIVFGSNVQGLGGVVVPACSDSDEPCWNTYLYDHYTGGIELINVNDAGEPSTKSFFTMLGGLSPDGRYVAFNTMADNLTDQSIPDGWQTYIRDRYTGLTIWVPADQKNSTSLIAGERLLLEEHDYYGKHTTVYLIPIIDVFAAY